MKEQIVSLPTAKIAKEKGFDWPVIHGFDLGDNPYVKNFEEPHCYNRRGCTSAPSQSLLAKWLRDEKNIHIIVSVNFGDWYFDLQAEHLYLKSQCEQEYRTYEEALEAGLLASLGLL